MSEDYLLQNELLCLFLNLKWHLLLLLLFKKEKEKLQISAQLFQMTYKFTTVTSIYSGKSK